MKRFLILLSAMLLACGTAGVASAAPYTWTDFIDFNPDQYVAWFSEYPYEHDLTDNTPSPFIAGQDLIYSYSLSVSMYDDAGQFDFAETAFVNQAGLFGDGFYNFSLTSQNFGWSIAGLIDLNSDGILEVTVESWWGDFYLASSLLTANGFDNGSVPVPEPTTLLIISISLFGLVAYGRKRLNKNA